MCKACYTRIDNMTAEGMAKFAELYIKNKDYTYFGNIELIRFSKVLLNYYSQNLYNKKFKYNDRFWCYQRFNPLFVSTEAEAAEFEKNCPNN